MPRDPHRVEISDRVRYQHILDAAAHAKAFVEGRARSDLDTDPKLTRAVLQALQEIGEAASRISDKARARAPDVPWEQIVGMRHRLVHVFWGVNLNHVWEVVERDLEPLVAQLTRALDDWPLDDS